MKYFLLILFFCFSLRSIAQHASSKVDTVIVKSDTLKHRLPSSVDSINLKSEKLFNRIESNPKKMTQKLDSASDRLDKVQGKGVDQLDSINNKIQKAASIPSDSINKLILNAGASIRETKVSKKIDSLQSLELPYEKYKTKLDSLNDIQSVVTKVVDKPLDKINRAENKISAIDDKPATQIEEKMQLLSKETGGRGNLPVNLPSSDLKMDALSVPTMGKLSPTNEFNTSIPTIDKPNLEQSLSLNNPDLKSKVKVPKGLDADKISDLKKGTGYVTKVSEKVSGYTEDVKKIKEGNVDQAENIQKEAISKLPLNNELQTLQKQDELIKSQQQQLQSVKNPEELKKQTVARAKKMVLLQMATQQTQLQDAVTKLSKYQNKATSILNKKSELPGKRDAWKRVKKHERFVPGLTLQIQKPNGWLFDINPSLRFRMTTYWSAGAGWNERLNFGSQLKSFGQGRIYGPRTFSELVLFKSFSLRLDAEGMNMFIPPLQNVSQDLGKSIWIWNYMAGIKKDFSFISRVTGNAQFMYNLYSTSSQRTYPTKFNVRVGFEYGFRKKSKQK